MSRHPAPSCAIASDDVESAKTESALAPHAGGGVRFVFQDVVYMVKVTEAGKPANALTKRTQPCKDRPLLRGITGEVRAGHVLANRTQATCCRREFASRAGGGVRCGSSHHSLERRCS